MWILLCILLLFFFCNEAIKQTSWFVNRFEEIFKYRSIPEHLDIINVGSNSGKYGFDYSEVDLKGLNCAVGPQTIAFDCKVLRRVIPHVHPGGWVIIPIVPFSSILDEYRTKTANDKYYLFLSPNEIPGYSIKTKARVWLSRFFPVLTWILHPKTVILYLTRGEAQRHSGEQNPMNREEMEKDANRWILGWKNQFSILKLDAPLSKEHTEIMKSNKAVLVEMIEICQKNSVIPVLVLPPMTDCLLTYLTQEIRQRYIYDFIEEIVRVKKTIFFDYTENKDFLKPDLYFNSLFLNQRGRKLFTSHLISEIKKLGK